MSPGTRCPPDERERRVPWWDGPNVVVLNFPGGALGVVTATNGAIPGRWIQEFQVVARHLTADFTDHNHATFHHCTTISVVRVCRRGRGAPSC
ncbi:hypothetical protein [Deinococcus planocerae]|uniref:hypothetical protein n=1 Tax=Deinococcus planocerae TaxID=1737569 RepID=UPI001CA4CC33|nr:hypothetical protein [Deinococcus planocerae]